MCASSLSFIDGSVMNVSLPTIGRNLGASAAELQWAINAYTLPLSALLLLGGAIGDRYGRKRFLILGIALFALASIGCALAPGLPVLLPMRAIQGIGAAILLPNSLATLGAAFTGPARGRAIGTWAAAGAIATAIGPPLGGWLVQAVGWRAIFWINLPVAAAAILIASRYVEESGASGSDGKRQPLDTPGALLATLALGALTWALTLWSATHRLTTSSAIVLGVGVAALVAFVRVEAGRGERAMMPLGLFGSRAFIGLTLLTFLLYGALGGLILLLPYTLITGGYTPLDAGLALLPFSVLIGIGSRLTGRIAAQVGARWLLGLGPLIAAAGFLLLVRVDPAGPYWTDVFPGVALIAAGMACAAAPLTTAVLASVDDRHTGTASGFNSAIARTGGLIATALAGAVIARQGAALLAAFHGAALIGAGLAAGASLSAFATLDGDAGKD